MEEYKQQLALILAESGALFFDQGLILKDGRPTPYFVNMGMFRTGRLCMELGSYFAGMMVDRNLVEQTDIILGPSYKGSAIAVATAIALYAHHGCDMLYEYDRKEAKTHGEGSRSGNLFVNETFFNECRVFVVDDVATSMGTKFALMDRITDEAARKEIDVKVLGIGIAIDREQTTALYDQDHQVLLERKGENTIKNFTSKTGVPVYSVAGIREIVNFLYQEKVPVMISGSQRPMDDETKIIFDKYLETYGIGD